jgi:hypothetical protein
LSQFAPESSATALTARFVGHFSIDHSSSRIALAFLAALTSF